jgi:putative toxin-antitoxin system antitoxin component (TIGR02293 family)
MIAAEKIADVMGLPGRRYSLSSLAERVSKGLPKDCLGRVVARAVSDGDERKRVMFRLVPSASYKRRRRVLSRAESERVERLARLVATAEYVWDDRAAAERFLLSPHPMLGGARPVDKATTELGARAAEEVLWKTFYGLPA